MIKTDRTSLPLDNRRSAESDVVRWLKSRSFAIVGEAKGGVSLQCDGSGSATVRRFDEELQRARINPRGLEVVYDVQGGCIIVYGFTAEKLTK